MSPPVPIVSFSSSSSLNFQSFPRYRGSERSVERWRGGGCAQNSGQWSEGNLTYLLLSCPQCTFRVFTLLSFAWSVDVAFDVFERCSDHYSSSPTVPRHSRPLTLPTLLPLSFFPIFSYSVLFLSLSLLQVMMITGDSEITAVSIAKQVSPAPHHHYHHHHHHHLNISLCFTVISHSPFYRTPFVTSIRRSLISPPFPNSHLHRSRRVSTRLE
jgi:hypothetical protein